MPFLLTPFFFSLFLAISHRLSSPETSACLLRKKKKVVPSEQTSDDLTAFKGIAWLEFLPAVDGSGFDAYYILLVMLPLLWKKYGF